MVEMQEGADFVAAVAVRDCQMKPPLHFLSVCRRCRAVLRHGYCRLQLGMRRDNVVRRSALSIDARCAFADHILGVFVREHLFHSACVSLAAGAAASLIVRGSRL